MSFSRSLITRDPFFSPFDDFFSTPFLVEPAPMPVLSDFGGQLRRSSPRYEISEDDKQFQLAVDVPGVKKDDMNVELQHGGRVIRITGGRKVKQKNSYTESKFEKSFTLDSSIDTSKITANLADGVLVVQAPKKEKEEQVHTIAITEGPHEPTPMVADKKE